MSDINELIHTTCMHAYNRGIETERERIVKLLEQETDIIYEFAYAIELIKGENK